MSTTYSILLKSIFIKTDRECHSQNAPKSVSKIFRRNSVDVAYYTNQTPDIANPIEQAKSSA